jgi:hypothetical protein
LTFEATAYFWLFSAIALLFAAIFYRVLWLVKKDNPVFRVEDNNRNFVGHQTGKPLVFATGDCGHCPVSAFNNNFCNCSFSERMILLIFNRRGPKKVRS